MRAPQILGNFIEPETEQEYLTIHFSPTSLPLQQRWRHNGLSADFLAEYWTTFFPADDAPSTEGAMAQARRAEIRGGVSYIANELLENVMKFSHLPADYAVTLELCLHSDVFRFYTRNAIDPQVIEAFQVRIQSLLTEDVTDLYIQQVERNALGGSGSHLGLLTMMSDYGAQLAWRFEFTARPELVILTTMVCLHV